MHVQNLLRELPIVIDVAGRTDKGLLREKNEDSYYVDSDVGLYIICDGLGGHLAGEIASQKAIEFTVAFFEKALQTRVLPGKEDCDSVEVWSRLVVEAVENCCDEVLAFAGACPEFDGMATTITVLLMVGDVAFAGYLGDSRLYLKHENDVKQLTSDHTLFEEFARTNPDWVESCEREQSLQRFRHVLTRCVGRASNCKVDAFCFPVERNDVLLLCTDGLSNYFPDSTSLLRFLDGGDADTMVGELIGFANQQGGHDNITAIVLRVLGQDERAEAKVNSSGDGGDSNLVSRGS